MFGIGIASLALLGVPARPALSPQAAPYMDFDSRLQVEPLLRPAIDSGLVAFRVLGGNVVLLYRDHLVVYDGSAARRTRLASRAESLLRLADGTTWLTDGGRVTPATEQGLDAARSWEIPPGARVDARGTDTVLLATEQDGDALFRLRDRNGALLNLVRLRGAIRCLSWNENGLAAVVGDALYRLEGGAAELRVLDRHADYEHASDVVGLPGPHALVSLRSTVRLLRPGYSAIVVARPARLDFIKNRAVLLDGAGIVWSVAGLEKLQSRAGDLAYATQLLEQARKECTGEPCMKRDEAARVSGVAPSRLGGSGTGR